MKIKNLILVVAIIFINSCTLSINKNFHQYQPQFISKSEFSPTKEEINSKKPKIVVFALDENDNLVSKQAGLGKTIANNLENILTENNLAQLIDRSANKKLKDEISLAELNKSTSYKGPRVADYAISGSISNANFSAKYVSGSTYVNPKNLQVISLPPQYKYIADVSGNIKIYELPSLKVIENIEFSGKETRSENVRNKGGVSFGSIQIGGEQIEGVQRDDGLVRKASQEAIKDISVQMKNIFSKTGYILEKRSIGKKSIFKVSIGRIDGIKKGDSFEIIGKYEVENQITGDAEIERRVIAKGRVSDKIDPESSWVVIDDNESINQIRIGDKVKLVYKHSFFSKILKLMK